MANVLERIKQESQNFVRRVSARANQFSITDRFIESISTVSDAEQRDMLFNGSIYKTNRYGGARKQVLETLGRDANESKYPIVAHFNPVPQIVNFYSNAFGGRLGEELKIVTAQDEPAAENLVTPIKRIWRWSNLDTRLDSLTSLCANQGTAGIRIVHESEPTPRVYLDFDDPRYFSRPPDVDARGNVISVYLEYYAVAYDENGTARNIKVEEVISKYGFSRKEDEVEMLTPEQQINSTGICPYVLMNHKSVPGSVLGSHAYQGSEPVIHAINFALSQLDESELAHIWPYIFATSPAKRPERLTAGKYTLLFSQTREGMPSPTFNPMVPDLDFPAIVQFAVQRHDWLQEKHPQMVLNNLKILSGISGETLRQALKPSESESMRARAIYENAMVRAVQIALSVGIVHRIPGFDLGTGIGTVQAAEAAYLDGEGPESFKFERRSPLPMTAMQKKEDAEAKNADQASKLELANAAKTAGMPLSEVFRLAGKDPSEVAALVAEAKAEADAEATRNKPAPTATPGGGGAQ